MFCTSGITFQKGNLLSFLTGSNVIGKQGLIRAADADSLEQAATTWDKIQDWFCGTDRVKAKQNVYLMHTSANPYEKYAYFLETCSLASPGHKGKFLVEQSDKETVCRLDGCDNSTFTLNDAAWGEQCDLANALLAKLHSKNQSDSTKLYCFKKIKKLAAQVGHPDADKFLISKNQFSKKYHVSLPLDQGGTFSLSYVHISPNVDIQNMFERGKHLPNSGQGLTVAKRNEQQFWNFASQAFVVEVAGKRVDHSLHPKEKVKAINAMLEGDLHLTEQERTRLYQVCTRKALTMARYGQNRSSFIKVPDSLELIRCQIYRDDTGKLQVRVTALNDFDDSKLSTKARKAAATFFNTKNAQSMPHDDSYARSSKFTMHLSINPGDGTSAAREPEIQVHKNQFAYTNF